MPERSYDALNQENREQAINYEPGYDWIPGKFGPPPGIPRAKKEQFDKMSDRDYLFAFMKLTQEEKESLMISEAERRRTFTAHWPIWNFIDGYACAKEGFYYTGVSDRVQCAFCAGIIRNWEKGDMPQQSHKNFFSYCKMAQRKPCHNIPYDESDIPKEILTEQLSTTSTSDSTRLKMNDLGISDNKPKYHEYSIMAKRMETFDRYDKKYPLSATDLCAAGFYYEGPGDKVKCFWCEGALELWTRGDNPWEEHARWYPGCVYVRQSKGVDFIKKARSTMSSEDIATSETLIYNSGDLSFLSQYEEESIAVENLDTFKICKSLGLDESLLIEAFKRNSKKDFKDVQDLISLVRALDDGDEVQIEVILQKYCKTEGDRQKLEYTMEVDGPVKQHKLEEIITKTEDLDEQESEALVKGMTCQQCNSNIVGAVVLPCGHFCLCQRCSRINLPLRCPQCDSVVKGACRAYLN